MERLLRWTGSRKRGMTLIELGVVLVIIGIILSIGTASWISYAGARKVVITAGEMRRAKDCLVQRILNDRMYPGFSTGGAYGSPDSSSVDACLGDSLDGWGRNLCYIQGLFDTSADPGLDERYCLLVNETTYDDSDPCSSTNSTNPPVQPHTTSRIVDDDGNNVDDVAFVIVSMGYDGVPDHTSYGTLFPNMDGRFEQVGSTNTAPWAAVMDGSTTPDFSDATTDPTTLARPDNEDIYLVVTFSELLAELAKARQ